MSAKHRRPVSKPRRAAVGVVAAISVLAVAAVLVVSVVFGSQLTGSSQPSATAQVLAKPAAASASAHPAPTSSATSSASLIDSPLQLIASTPSPGATSVNGGAPIRFDFDAPVSMNAGLPVISPTIDGTWSQPSPSSLEFDPATGFAPDTAVTVSVPAIVQAIDGGLLTNATTISYTTGDASLVRLQQLLADLAYLPLTFAPTTPEPTTLNGEMSAMYEPPDGTFTPRFSNTPQALQDLWQEGAITPLTTGAIMSFENQHHMKVDGQAGPAVWAALMADAVADAPDPEPYTWAWTTMTRPETLQIWSNGAFVFASSANTGIPAAPTPLGSWPVFARYRSQTMSGLNPDGSKYSDPGVPYINYFHGGDAIHGFLRGSYGRPQSLGCVELPYTAASQVWTLIDYGTVVTVSS
jgi:hypothetical protein